MTKKPKSHFTLSLTSPLFLDGEVKGSKTSVKLWRLQLKLFQPLTKSTIQTIESSPATTTTTLTDVPPIKLEAFQSAVDAFAL